MNKKTGCGETAIRDPLYVFAVSNWLDSDHDRRSDQSLCV